jgi:hypothetical protein
MSQFEATGIAPRNAGISNGREVGAYAIAQIVKIALTYAASLSGVLSPLYLAAYHHGGAVAVFPVTFAIGVVWGAVTLILFLLLRAGLGGVPAMIADPGRENVVTTRGGEIGAFVVAYLTVAVALMVLNGMFLGPLYVSLSRSGQGAIAFAIGISFSTAGAVAVYFLFIALRAAFCRR